MKGMFREQCDIWLFQAPLQQLVLNQISCWSHRPGSLFLPHSPLSFCPSQHPSLLTRPLCCLGGSASSQSTCIVSTHSSQGSLTAGHLVLWVSEPVGPRRALPSEPRWSPGAPSHKRGMALATASSLQPALFSLYLTNFVVDFFFSNLKNINIQEN